MDATRGARLGRFLASWRALALVAVVLTILTVFGVRALQLQITQRAVESAVLGAQTIELLVVAQNLTLEDIWLAVDQRNEDAMDADLTLIRSGGAVVGLRVWALVDGHLVYSDSDHRQVPGQLPDAARHSVASGRPYTLHAVDPSTGLKVLCIYLPNDANGDGVFDAATEVIVPQSRIDGTVTAGVRWLNAGAAAGLLAVFGVLFMIRRHQNSQEYAATHDQLTGLGNRVLLARRASAALARATTGSPVALMLIDLDGFKGVNDTLGHQAGDELLITVAQRLSAVCSRRAMPIRLGGDEFAVLTNTCKSRDEALALARVIQAELRKSMRVTDVPVEIDGSIGVAFAPMHAQDLAVLMRCADLAMYDAKQRVAGIVCFDANSQHGEEPQVTLVPEVRRALSAGELELLYQPMHSSDGSLIAVEALLFWRHPTRGMLTADDFVHQVARTSLIKDLNGWVLRSAMTDGAVWQTLGRRAPVAVNLPLRELLDPTLTDRLHSYGEATGFALTDLRLEITEADLSDKLIPAVVPAVRGLQALGVTVALDGVGAGYHALKMLAELPIHSLKLDAWLSEQVSADELAASRVRHLAALAHGSGADCAAMGVKTVSDWRLLSDLGCDGAQGEISGPPVPAADLWARIDVWNDTQPADRKPVSR